MGSAVWRNCFVISCRGRKFVKLYILSVLLIDLLYEKLGELNWDLREKKIHKEMRSTDG